MKLKLLIATGDGDYAEHLSGVLSENHAETFEISVCSSEERMQHLITVNRYDVMLIEPGFNPIDYINQIKLVLILWDDSIVDADCGGLSMIRKYQRISKIAGNILEYFSEISAGPSDFGAGRAHITAVWSPCGGTGKTTIALAYAARKVSEGKQVVYLNLENFSSISAYFNENGKSISTVFERLESNVHMLFMGIRQIDSGSGITYYCGPDNYDDMTVLTGDDIEVIINSCATGDEELVIDLSSQCDKGIQKVFDLADNIIIVSDSSSTSQIKLRQFINQNNIFQNIQGKSVLINNKGAKTVETGIDKIIYFPLVQSNNPVAVYKTLSGNKFEW